MSRRITSSLFLCTLIGCTGSQLREQPVVLEITEPIAISRDSNIEAALDWVIVRDGPGSWAEEASWDEYLIRIQNNSPNQIALQRIAVYDYFDERFETEVDRRRLIALKNEIAMRYAGEGIDLTETEGRHRVLTSLEENTVARNLVGGVATILLYTPPGLVIGLGVIGTELLRQRADDEASSEVIDMMFERQTRLPVTLSSGEQKGLNFFFPIAPSPSRIELIYNTERYGTQVLFIDTGEVLSGLHFVADSTPNSR